LDNTLVAGGPKKTDCFNMTAADAVQAMKDYQNDRKTYTDCVRWLCHKQSED
jgi:hypothetical protein